MADFNPECMFTPWVNDTEFKNALKKVSGNIIVPSSRCWVLWNAAKRILQLEVEGEFWECGVFRGGSASIIADAIRPQNRTLRLFDTFTGIPPDKDKVDANLVGSFANTNIDLAKQMVGYDQAVFYKGLIPDTFAGLESSKIALCHIDVDMYRAVQTCCEFVWPRLAVGGAIVFDDYAVPSCPGARAATDEFFEDKQVWLIQSLEGGAIMVKPPQDGDVVVRPPVGWTIEFKSPNIREWSLGRLKVSWKK